MRSTASRDVEKYRQFLKSGMPGPHAYVVLLGLNQFDWPGVLAQIEKGLPNSAVDRFLRNTGFTLDQLLDLVQIAPRTFMRRKAQGRLSSSESDRLVRVARVFARALYFFDGDAAAATEWLTEAQYSFGGIPPVDLMRTEVGALEVERLIGQLEHGVFP
jgi:putative toxin-antitoxin system antitoxin component (TIGR02293 family)